MKERGSFFVEAAVHPRPAVRIIAAPENTSVFDTRWFMSSSINSGFVLEFTPAYMERRPRATRRTPITATVMRTHFLSQAI